MIHLLVLCLENCEIDIVTAKLGLILVGNDIDLKALEYSLFEAIQILQKNLALFLVSILLETHACAIENCHVLWGKTSTDQKKNIEYDE